MSIFLWQQRKERGCCFVYSSDVADFCSPPQGGPAQEAGPGSGDPALPQVYASPVSYAQQGQGPSTSVGRLPPLEFNSAHASSEYSEHPQLRVYQGPQLEGAEPLTSSSTVSSRLELTSRPEVQSTIKYDLRLMWEDGVQLQVLSGTDRVSFYI